MAVSVNATCVGKSDGKAVDVTTAKDGNPAGDDDIRGGVVVFSTACAFGLVLILLKKNNEVINPMINKIANKPFTLRGCFILVPLIFCPDVL